MRNIWLPLIVLGSLIAGCNPPAGQTDLSQGPRRIEILFLGHESQHHNSEKLMPLLAIPLFQQGINLTYTSDPNDLSGQVLKNYDGIMIYANHDEITSEQEKALKDYIEGGKALLPIHSASFCFRNSDWFVSAVGGQFKSHGTGDFTAEIINKDHPVMAGISEFETWDETYVHSQVNPDMTVLMERVEGSHREPYTWIREQGQGKVFYTAYGHDERTWAQPEFHKLIANAVMWAVGEKVAQQVTDYAIPIPKFEDAEIPNYERRDPAPRYQLPLTPEESMKLVQVPVGFELELFAAEPDIINPMAMAWDERGRLFVIETTDYPNEVRQEGGNDRIKILEDTNGDGKADKITIFAENLNIPTSITFANGGIIISMAPDFVFLKDTNGDGKADVRVVIMTGWGKSDTHAGPSNLKYGLDNKYWGVLGYSGFNGEVSGTNHAFGQGVYRFDGDGKNLEFLGTTTNNTWGLGFTEDFEVFISTANGMHSAYLAFSNRYLKRPVYRGSTNTVFGIDSHYDMPHLTPFLRQVDWHGGYTAAAGHNFYTARDFPKNYWNRIAFVAEPTGRVLHNAIIEANGSGYREKNGFNILASSDEWFSPVHAEVGPDGALWIADWYNFIIQHNPTPRGFENGAGNAYINPLRDNRHGRIYRLKYKNAGKPKTFSLENPSNKNLINALKSDNMFWRTTAQRLIVETQNKELIRELYGLIDKQETDEIGLNAPAIHALWTLHGLGELDGSNQDAIRIVHKALSHPSAGVRKNALRVLPKNQSSLDALISNNLISDPDMNTRKTAFLMASDMPFSPILSKQLVSSSELDGNREDTYMPQAIFSAVLSHPVSFAQTAVENAGYDKPDSLLTLSERISRSLVEEQYNLDRRAPILFPPDVASKEITIKASISKGNENMEGVIVAQGGKENGYSLFIENNAITWLVKQNGKPYQIRSSRNLPEEQFTLIAKLMEGGEMSLEINGRNIGKTKAPDLFKEELNPARVRIGFDNLGSNNVGDHPENFGFRGRLGQDASLSLNNPAASGMDAGESSGETSVASSVGSIIIKMGVIQHEMKFDKASFTVKAGQQVTIDFENKDFMQHNLVISKPGTFETVGKAADEMARNPDGAALNFVPTLSEIIIATKLVDPNNTESIVFKAPEVRGDYPYICTVPGHWRIMNGIMKVE